MGYVVDSSSAYASNSTASLISLAFIILSVIGMWKLYVKAGEHGWAAIIPFYNMYVLFKLATGKGWLFILLIIPVVNVIATIYMLYKLSKAFGHGIGFTIGLIIFEPIFMMILGFGQSEYQGVQ